jgi:hypothetical protein
MLGIHGTQAPVALEFLRAGPGGDGGIPVIGARAVVVDESLCAHRQHQRRCQRHQHGAVQLLFLKSGRGCARLILAVFLMFIPCPVVPFEWNRLAGRCLQRLSSLCASSARCMTRIRPGRLHCRWRWRWRWRWRSTTDGRQAIGPGGTQRLRQDASLSHGVSLTSCSYGFLEAALFDGPIVFWEGLSGCDPIPNIVRWCRLGDVGLAPALESAQIDTATVMRDVASISRVEAQNNKK